MARAGALDRLVQFQRAALVDDGFSSVETWANHGAAVWAEKRDVSDGERARAGIVEAQLMTRFKLRYSAFTAGLTPADRLVCEGVTYNITGIKEAEGRREWLEISCTARAS
jgi:head-tail adaptor